MASWSADCCPSAIVDKWFSYMTTHEYEHESAGYSGAPDGKPMTRALRRFHRRRMIRHARSIFAGDLFPEELRKWAEKRHDHLCRCLCYLCRNKRERFGPTIQEQRVFQGDPVGDLESEREQKARSE